MLDTLISSKTRVKLLLKFFLNPKARSYLRGLEAEFGESSNAIRMELNRFEAAGLLEAEKEGNKKIFGANTRHPLFGSIQNLIRSYVGIDHLMENVVSKLGDVKAVYLTGDLARGIESSIIDLIFIAETIDTSYLSQLITKAEKFLNRKIRYVIFTQKEWRENPMDGKEALVIYAR